MTLPRRRCWVARKSAWNLRRDSWVRISADPDRSWWPFTHANLTLWCNSFRRSLICDRRSESNGWRWAQQWRLQNRWIMEIFDLLSVISLKRQRCPMPQFLAILAISSRADAIPASSQRVDYDVSDGPPTGPPHWKREEVADESIQPKVPFLQRYTPSEAI